MIISAGINSGGDAFPMFGCAIALSMGVSFGTTPPPARGWASTDLQQQFLSTFPSYVLRVLAPGWMKKYQAIKQRLLACTQDDEPAFGLQCRCTLS